MFFDYPTETLVVRGVSDVGSAPVSGNSSTGFLIYFFNLRVFIKE